MDLFEQRYREMPQYRYKIKILKDKKKNKGDDVEVKKLTELKETNNVEESAKKTKSARRNTRRHNKHNKKDEDTVK